ncbi:hypothetical protein Taro_004315, partial [Colocasia esculenta]|nr:hypothetical protein [Colocasia esculenta]
LRGGGAGGSVPGYRLCEGGAGAFACAEDHLGFACTKEVRNLSPAQRTTCTEDVGVSPAQRMPRRTSSHGEVERGVVGHVRLQVNVVWTCAGVVQAMWTFMVVVSLNSIRVDANLCDLQNIGLPEDSFLSSFSLSLALFSCPLLPHYFQELYKVIWRIVECEVVTKWPRKRQNVV